MNQKKCSKCQRKLDVSFFAIKKGKQLQSVCKACQRLLSKEWYNNNKEHHLNNVKRTNASIRDAVRRWKESLSCTLCAEREPCCLELHHIDDNEKDFNLSYAWMSFGLPKFIDEVNKCIVLCSNCHKKIHKGVLTLPANVCTIHLTVNDIMSL